MITKLMKYKNKEAYYNMWKDESYLEEMEKNTQYLGDI